MSDSASASGAAGTTQKTPTITEAQCMSRLRHYTTIEKKSLGKFFKDDDFKGFAAPALNIFNELVKEDCSVERAMKFMVLAMYDLVILIDDSDTMEIEEEGQRKETLKQVLDNITRIYTYARKDGVVGVRFFNTKKKASNVTDARVKQLMNMINWSGLTMIGTNLQEKILNPFVYEKKGKMTKPLLIVVITDGDIEGEKKDLLKKTMQNCISSLQGDGGNEMKDDAVAFYFARVGNNPTAADLIKRLDDDEDIGQWVDCFPVNDRLEEVNHDDKDIKWRVLSKLMLGALWSDIDRDDEAAAELKDIEEQKVEAKVTVDEDEEIDWA